MANGEIDIVVTWVDGSDPEWVIEKNKYDLSKVRDSSNRDSRYRDWDLMRYFFRGIEKNCPWVNKVFFVTWGHIPQWLNTCNEKLCVIRHEDYIPKEYLPTFNSNVIELNFHRIKALSENFILFNDDFFVVDKISDSSFFRNDKPRDMLLAKTLVNYSPSSMVWHMVFNDMGVINKYFEGGKSALKHLGKWINPVYGTTNNIANLMKMPGKRLSSFYDHHLPMPYKKSLFKKLWELEGPYLDATCHNKFRTPLDLNHWLMRYWRLASGEFEPINLDGIGKYYEFGETKDSVDKMCEAIRSKERPVLVLNDTLDGKNEKDFEEYKGMIMAAFEEILPDKCSFEH